MPFSVVPQRCHGRPAAWGLLALVMVLAVSACSASEGSPPQPAHPTPLRIAQAWDGSEAQQFTTALRHALAQTLPGVPVEVFSSSAGITNLMMLQRREVDAAATYADIAYMASVGDLPSMTGPFGELRGIAALPIRELQVLVAPGLPIKSIADLRGRRVSLGPVGTGVALTARLLLSAYGLGLQDIHAEYLEFGDVLPFLNGEIDAMFMGGLIPNPFIGTATARGARLLQIMGPELERFRAEYPFLRATVIPAGTYPGMDEPVHTVGVDRVFVCRADLDERFGYQLTKAFMQAITTAGPGARIGRGFNMARASATPLPLHPGAARYYRELEMRR